MLHELKYKPSMVQDDGTKPVSLEFRRGKLRRSHNKVFVMQYYSGSG